MQLQPCGRICSKPSTHCLLFVHSGFFCLVFPVLACTTDSPSRIFLGSVLDYFMVNLFRKIHKFPLSSQCCSWSQSRLSLLTFPCCGFSAAHSLCVVLAGDERGSQEHALRVVLHRVPQPGEGHLAISL